jgi:hypothetical protein
MNEIKLFNLFTVDPRISSSLEPSWLVVSHKKIVFSLTRISSTLELVAGLAGPEGCY